MFFRKKNQESIYSAVIKLNEAFPSDALVPTEEASTQQDSRDPVFEKQLRDSSRQSVPRPRPRADSAEYQPANLVDLKFAYIPPGTFVMGSPEYELGRNNDEGQHEVNITRGFQIQITPVTVKQWRELMGKNPSCFPNPSEECSVDGISWNECQEFIRKLNQQGDATYRLPTESEWEYACRAGSTTSLTNGELTQLFCSLDSILDEVGWYCGNSGRKIHPVGRKHPNAWGLYDIHGNVFEWCHDCYGEYPSTPQEDPHGPVSGPGRVIRGGSWFSSAKSCRSASRSCWPPDSRGDFIGFRLVKAA